MTAICSEVGRVVSNVVHGIYPTTNSEVAEPTAETEGGTAEQSVAQPTAGHVQAKHSISHRLTSKPGPGKARANIHRPRWDSPDVILPNHVTQVKCTLSPRHDLHDRSRSWYITQPKTGQALHADCRSLRNRGAPLSPRSRMGRRGRRRKGLFSSVDKCSNQISIRLAGPVGHKSKFGFRQ